MDFKLRQMFDLYNKNQKISKTAKFFHVKSYNVINLLKKLPLRRYFLKVIFVTGTTSVLGCSGADWKNYGDSCIIISEKPPLRRVINYSDHDLCGRKLSPRTAPNPLTRIKTE